MIRRIRLFIKKNVLRGWMGRIIHLIFAIIFVMVLFIPGLYLLNLLVLNFYILAKGYFLVMLTVSEVYFITFALMLIWFNLSIFARKINIDILIALIGLLLTYVATEYILLQGNERMPWLQVTLFIVANLIFLISAKNIALHQEHTFLRQAFGRYIDSELLEDLLASPESLETGGEQKNMTVLFCDLRGFTTFSEQMTPKELVQVLNLYFNEMSHIILHNKGTIDKYIGDAIMAFWNAPVADKNHANNALISAMQMAVKLNWLRVSDRRFEQFQIGIGINTGKMVIGNLGSRKRFDYTVIGDNVNLGSRLEGLTKKYGIGILVTQSVLDNLNGEIPGVVFRLVDDVVVKGKTESIRIYEPLADNPGNVEIVDLYGRAFQAYQEGNFDRAIVLFEELSARKDPASTVMLQRCRDLLQSNPVEWKGIWAWNGK